MIFGTQCGHDDLPEEMTPRYGPPTKNGKCGIWTTGSYPFEEIPVTPSNGFVRTEISSVDGYSGYAPLSETSVVHERILHELVLDAGVRFSIVIAGEFNALSTEWGSNVSNHRRLILSEAITSLDIMLDITYQAS